MDNGDNRAFEWCDHVGAMAERLWIGKEPLALLETSQPVTILLAGRNVKVMCFSCLGAVLRGGKLPVKN